MVRKSVGFFFYLRAVFFCSGRFFSPPQSSYPRETGVFQHKKKKKKNTKKTFVDVHGYYAGMTSVIPVTRSQARPDRGQGSSHGPSVESRKNVVMCGVCLGKQVGTTACQPSPFIWYLSPKGASPIHHGNVLLSKLLQGHSTLTSLTPSGIKRSHSAHLSMSNGVESSPN